jgi:DNA repair protein RecO (recombination protein O)
MTITTPAFLIKKKDYKDSDKIAVFLSKDLGKISGLGKFAKKSIKRNLNLLDFGFLLNVELNQNNSKDIYFIEKVTLMENFLHKTNYRKFLILSYVSELLYYVVYGEEESATLFNETVKFFKTISNIHSENSNVFLSALTLYKIKLLEAIGYKIITDKCVVCGKEDAIFNYSLEKIGFICNKCCEKSETLTVSKGTKKVIANINKNIKLTAPIMLQLDEIFHANIRKIVSINGYNKIRTLGNIIKNGI